MSIIVQRKRILVNNFLDDESLKKFNRYLTINKDDLYGNTTSSWIAGYEVKHRDEYYVAIPRRANLEHIDEFLEDDGPIQKDSVPAHPFRKIELKLNASPRSEEQHQMVDFLIGRNNYSHLSNKIKKALFSETGSGKTFCTIFDVASKGVFPLINCPNERAIKTWKDEFLKFTDIKPEEIVVLSGKDSFKKILKKIDSYKVILASSKTFSSMFLDGKYDEVADFLEKAGVGMLVHDESHLNLMVMFYLEMISNTKHTLFLTATPERRMYKENKVMESLMPPENSTYIQEPKRRFTVIYGKFYSNLPKPAYKGIQKPRGPDFNTFANKIIFNQSKEMKETNEFIMEDVIVRIVKDRLKKRSKLSNGEFGRIAIMGISLNHTEILYELLKKRISKYSIGRFDTTIKDIEERYKECLNDVFVTTNKSMDGISNFPNLECVISLIPYGGSHIKQIMGRIRDEEKIGKRSVFIQLVDGSCKPVLKAAYRQKSGIEDITLEFKELEFNTKETLFEEVDDD